MRCDRLSNGVRFVSCEQCLRYTPFTRSLKRENRYFLKILFYDGEENESGEG